MSDLVSLRPEWCLDPTCTPDARTQDKRDGGSGFCCGRTAEPMVTNRQGISHENDGHFCVKSSRGITMLEICSEDLQVMARNALRSLVARSPEVTFSSRWFIGREVWESG